MFASDITSVEYIWTTVTSDTEEHSGVFYWISDE